MRRIEMTSDYVESDTHVLNFDEYDTDENQVVRQGGYVMTRQDDDDQCFYVTVFNSNGDVLSETIVNYYFEEA